MLEHGGRLRRAAETYRIPVSDWVDLSTGINPHGYPVPPVPAEAWLRLPEDDDGLEAAAAEYYGSAELLPVAGSQPAIQALPAVLRGERVSLLAPGYAEHAHAWRERRPRALAAAEIDAAVADSDIVVLVQPNNPTGVHFGRERLLDWHSRLAARGGWLVVDEAFIDTTPAASLVPSAGAGGLVVLRSVGKFFGLAGARVGFVFAPAGVRAALAEHLGPWTLSGPARWAARHALANRAWQARARSSLLAAGTRLQALLATHGLQARGPALFKLVESSDAARLHAAFARRGILLRLFESPHALRFGLPADEAAWQRLAAALKACL
ncbi:Threonine-phosphate decarboxylase [Thauera sp. GDN1]|uniref:threonine-phosphate decarboxylase CobD n=1 Tax=Thauera sp. GDN1 TaxID=2944810 RepID=UPI002478C902|nr:threonine-phosphate decarboxylase CobD [Thauera sp. GDN1]WEN40934.1 Threonine-phosphate decarboxylase [Thauera sp. GDN1]